MKLSLSISLAVAAYCCFAGAQATDNYSSGPHFHPSVVVQSEEGLGKEVRVAKGKVGEISFRYYPSDFSALFQGTPDVSVEGSSALDKQHWSVNCNVDKFSDIRTCYIRHYQGELWIFADPSGVWVSVGTENYPGSNVAVRVDGGKPVGSRRGSDDFDKKTSAQIIAQFRKGQTVVSRYMRWPYKSFVDTEESLFGIGAAIDYVQWAVKQRSGARN